MENEGETLIEVHESDGTAIVRVLGPELRQPAQAIALGEQLNALAATGRHVRMLVDFGSVQYMGSTGFASLLVLSRKAKAAGVRLALFGFQPEVRFGADILGIGTLIPIHEDEAAALAS